MLFEEKTSSTLKAIEFLDMASDSHLIHDSLPLIRLNCITEVITKAQEVVVTLKWELLSLLGYLNFAVYVFLPGTLPLQPDTTSPISFQSHTTKYNLQQMETFFD